MLRPRSSDTARALFVALLLCVLAMRVVVPQGFMWSSDADGSPRMVFCSGSGTLPGLPTIAAAAIAAQHHSDQEDHGKSVEHPCAFTAASAAVDLTGAVHPATAQPAPSAATVTAYRFARLGLAAPPPPKTGPPLLA